jgi:hypothetical protein
MRVASRPPRIEDGSTTKYTSTLNDLTGPSACPAPRDVLTVLSKHDKTYCTRNDSGAFACINETGPTIDTQVTTVGKPTARRERENHERHVATAVGVQRATSCELRAAGNGQNAALQVGSMPHCTVRKYLGHRRVEGLRLSDRLGRACTNSADCSIYSSMIE